MTKGENKMTYVVLLFLCSTSPVRDIPMRSRPIHTYPLTPHV